MSENRSVPAEAQKYVTYLQISDELRADCDPEYANSPEYLARHPRPIRTWRDPIREAYARIPWLIARPVWLLGEGFDSLGYAVANAVAWTLRVKVRYVKSERSEYDDD